MATEYISLLEISDELGVSVRTLRYWAARGMLPGAVRYGRTWRVKRSQHSEWRAEKHLEQAQQVAAWQSSINDPEARISKLALQSGESFEGSRLLAEAERRRNATRTPRKNALIS